jgi:hypothetical protein
MFRLQTYLYRAAHLLKSCWQLFSNEAATNDQFWFSENKKSESNSWCSELFETP